MHLYVEILLKQLLKSNFPQKLKNLLTTENKAIGYFFFYVPASWHGVLHALPFLLAPDSHDICGNSQQRHQQTCSEQKIQPKAKKK